MVSSTKCTQNFIEPPKQNSITFQKCAYSELKQRMIEPNFEARVENFLEACTKRIERFKEAIYKKREDINERMIEMFSLLKELRKGKSLEKVLVREEVNKPITKYVNTISLVRTKNEKDKGGDEVVDKSLVDPLEPIENDEPIYDVMDNKSNRSMNEGPTRWGKYEDRLMKMPMSQLIGYYLKHEINEKIIEGLVDNHKYNDSLLATCLGKMSNKTYNSLPVGPMYIVILKKKLARKEKRRDNFVIPYSIWRLKFINVLADQGSNVNIMLLFIYDKLTIKKPVATNIRLYLANHSYDYPLEIAEYLLIDVAGFVYPVDFFILDIKGNEHMPLILGTPFLTTARAEIEFENVTPQKFQVNIFKHSDNYFDFYTLRLNPAVYREVNPCKSEKTSSNAFRLRILISLDII
ncbi:MAK10-like protein [Tanacetum coccineum]